MNIEKLKALIFIIITIIDLLAAYLVWRRGKDKATFYLGWYFFFAAAWCFSWAGVYYFPDKEFWSRAHWAGGGFMGAFYLLFACFFTGHTRFIRLKIFALVSIGLIFAFLSLTTPLFIASISPEYPYLTKDSSGLLNTLVGRPYTLFVGLLALYYLIKSYRLETGRKKWQLKYFIWGMFISTIATVVLSGVLSVMAVIGPIANEYAAYFALSVVIFTIYAIFKNSLFDIKVVLTELLVAVIGLVLFSQIFLSAGTQAKIISLTIFFLFSVSGYLLIKSTNKEIEKERQARELAGKLEELNLNLGKRVDEKTKLLQAKVGELSEAQKALINILEDNTEAREAMEKEKNKTAAIIANFTDPIIVLDKDHKIGMINPAAVKVFELSKADLGKPVSLENKFSMANFKAVIKKDFQIKEIDKRINHAEFVSEEIVILVGDQEATYKVITAKVLGASREALGIMKIFYDLTREKTIDRMKSEFISIAAHQLRTPLSAIKWVIKMILDGDAGQLNMEQQELLNKGYISNERIIRLVNDLLNVSRIEEGRFGFDFKEDDFAEVLSAAVSNLGELISKNHQEIIINRPDSLPKIYMDKERMIMVVQNLLDNAVKYTPEYGKIKINLEFDNRFLRVKIKDQGVGIPKADQAKLFTKFFRATNAVRLETEGTGLGLFIVKNIVEKHGGEVNLNSEEGQGTEVNFTLPLKPPSA